jgi:amino acid transporter
MISDGAPRAELRRALGWPAVTAYGLGAILGAGIYSVIGAAAGLVGDGMWLAFLASAVVALVTALSYAELTTMFPRAGAEFLYIQHAVPRHPVVAFGGGAMMAVSAAATAATVSIAFGGYLARIVDLPASLVAPVLITALMIIALIGVKESAWMVAAFTCIEAAGLIVVIVVGATSPRFGDAFVAAPHANVFAGAALVFFSYLGFENIANLAEETRSPERNLPRAILLSLGIATLLYVLVAVSAVALLPAGDLARSGAPLADVVRARSPALAGALGGVALFATANTAMAAIVSGSRILYAMARAGELPPVLARVSRRSRIPWAATLLVTVLSLLLIPLGSVAVVASISSFASLLAFAAVNLALAILRRRDPAHPRPFRVPLSIGRVPVLPIAGAAFALFLIAQLARDVIVAGLGLVALTVAVYWSMRFVARNRGVQRRSS